MPGFLTNEFYLYDPTDDSKQLRFDTSALLTGTLNTLIVPSSAVNPPATICLDNRDNNFTTGQTITGASEFKGAAGGGGIILRLEANASQSVDILQGQDTAAATQFALNKDAWLTQALTLDSGFVFYRQAGGSQKQFKFNASGISAGAQREFSTPDNNGAVVIVGTDAPAVAAGNLGRVFSINNGAIGSTNLTNTAVAQFYRVSYALYVTTADITAGTIQFQISYTDAVGATTRLGTAIVLTATGRDTGSFVFALASGEISYQTNLTGIAGTSSYDLQVRVETLI